MTKFSIASLETARKNPADFAKTLLAGSASSGFGYPKSLRWLNAVNTYHQTTNIADAFTSIENGFSSRKDTSANRREVATFLLALNYYEANFKNLKYSLIKSREHIDLPLSNKLKISGHIPLIFMKPIKGFAAFFVSKNNPTWQVELKYPILQDYIARSVFSVDPKEIEIGYIDFHTGDFIKNCFTARERKNAKDELDSIGNVISSYLL